MKKILAIALALVMMLSLSATAFADPTGSMNDTGTTGTGADVYARYIPNNTVSAAITWGDMYFVYDSASATWSLDTISNTSSSNAVTVTNNSPELTLSTSYDYTPAVQGEYAGYLYAVPTTAVDSYDTYDGTYYFNSEVVDLDVLTVLQLGNNPVSGGTLSPLGGSETYYMMFNTMAYSNLRTTSVKVGTLTITLS